MYQCPPPSVVLKTAPLRPTIQHTDSLGADPASNSAVTPLFCGTQVIPLSTDCSIRPADSNRHRTVVLEARMTFGFSRPTFFKAAGGSSLSVTSPCSVCRSSMPPFPFKGGSTVPVLARSVAIAVGTLPADVADFARGAPEVSGVVAAAAGAAVTETSVCRDKISGGLFLVASREE